MKLRMKLAAAAVGVSSGRPLAMALVAFWMA